MNASCLSVEMLHSRHISTTPWEKVYGEKKDVSKFRPFGCKAYMHLNKERREKGKHTPHTVKVINLGFASDNNTSGYKLYNPTNQTNQISNQVKFDELIYPYRKAEMIGQQNDDCGIDILYQSPSDIKWIEYDKSMVPNGVQIVHSERSSGMLVLKSRTQPDTFIRVNREQFFKDSLDVEAARGPTERTFTAVPIPQNPNSKRVAGLPACIDPTKPPKNFKDAMSRPDRQQWAEAYNKEYQGFIERGTFVVVKPEKGEKVLGTTTRLDYNMVNGVFDKRKVRLCVRGDQQQEGIHFRSSDLYSPALKAPEAGLIAAIAAEHNCRILKTDTKQAFLYGEMGDEKVYIRPPDWWPEPIPEGHALLLKKSIYGTRQAARKWHQCISEWMESHGYPAVNSEKIIFMKCVGGDFIMHGLFVDDMMHAPTCDKLWNEFLELYSKDFEITGGGIMECFLGMEVEQSDGEIRLHLDKYLRETLDEYKEFIKKSLRPKTTLMRRNIVLEKEDCPEVPGQRFRSFVVKLQFAATCVRYDTSLGLAQLACFCASAGPSHWAALH